MNLLCTKLEGVTLISGSFYWLRMAPYKHELIQSKYDLMEECCHETFFQGMLNLYLNDILDPLYVHTCSCCAHIQTFGDFIKRYDNYDEIMSKQKATAESSANRYTFVTFAQKYVDEYLTYFNAQNIPLFEHLQKHTLPRFVDFIKHEYNKNYTSYHITDEDINMLKTNFALLIKLHTKCNFSQPWPSAIYVFY